jgi:hypothetical protein
MPWHIFWIILCGAFSHTLLQMTGDVLDHLTLHVYLYLVLSASSAHLENLESSDNPMH